MTTEPKTRLNRILLTAIVVMTLAIFILAAAIIWKLFLAGDQGQDATPLVADTDVATGIGARADTNNQVRSLVSGSASLRYILPAGCTDQITTGENSIQVLFRGTTCSQRQIEAIAGNVTLAVE